MAVGTAMLATQLWPIPWKDESGKGRWGGGVRGYYGRSYNEAREYEQEYRQGNSKVERKWERDGGYKLIPP
ncbi:hypothetical protein KIP88_22505 [Bradyrhizobium sp. SRL28]|uniref:hypothetical protein n=1 Tax=Bradyrhizobium sp. SRL28 TaxID=2836178 RepID=UPI001BDF075D|nr:hypothetical protein [Bradyrhizobium sp. SRL28]MBT1513267.1 hypothetical protein [Bradyrhizobium sp. SRL28]